MLTFSVVDYLVFGGILAFLNGTLVLFSSQKAGRLVAAVLGVYMGVFDYSDLDPLLPLQDSYVAYTIFSTSIEIPMYTVYSTLVAGASFIGLTVPLFRGIVSHLSLVAISAISIVSAIVLGKLSWFSLFQLGLFGASCLLGGTYLYWDGRKNRMLTQEAKS